MFGIMYFDGATVPNPGNSGIGVVCYKDNKKHFTYCENIGFHTNNECEFIALIRGLEVAKEQGFTSLIVKGDSNLVVNMANGKWNGSKPELIKLKLIAQNIISNFKSFHLSWIPRERNRGADFMSNLGLKTSSLKVYKKIEVKKEIKKTVIRRRENEPEKRIIQK